MQQWYVFDKYDLFDNFETAGAAATHAEWMVAGGNKGVHIAYMTETEAAAYCETGTFPFSK